MSDSGIIINIQRYTIHDGPGIRTELFLKGCPLVCEWCGNPESWSSDIQLGVYNSKCIGSEKCNSCYNVCPIEGALVFKDGKLISIDETKCINCLACVNECPSDAIKQWGQIMDVEQCMIEIRKDMGYYQRSGGGVTVSGGEPLVQSDFVLNLFKACHKEGISTCCESSLNVHWKQIANVLPYTDIVIADIKHMDTYIHKKYTGAYNELILENLKKIVEEDKDLILRIPIIPDVNDDMKNIVATADFIINELKGRIRTLQLLSFMRLGEEKYESLNMEYKMKDLELNRIEFQSNINEIAKYFNNRGINCMVGTKEKE